MASAINEQVLNTFLAAHARLATAMKGISGQLGGKTPKVSQKDFQELIDSGADLLKESVKLAVLLGVKLEASEDKKTAAKKTTAKKAVAKKEEAAVEEEVEETHAKKATRKSVAKTEEVAEEEKKPAARKTTAKKTTTKKAAEKEETSEEPQKPARKTTARTTTAKNYSPIRRSLDGLAVSTLLAVEAAIFFDSDEFSEISSSGRCQCAAFFGRTSRTSDS